MKRFTPAALIFLLAGCATGPNPWLTQTNAGLEPAEVLAFQDPLVCKGEEQCKLWWRRAEYFVTTRAGFAVRVATPNMIETYYPAQPYAMRWGIKVWKEPVSVDSDRIWAAPSCGPAPICQDHPARVIMALKRYVRFGD
jgi:hypothetical protein